MEDIPNLLRYFIHCCFYTIHPQTFTTRALLYFVVCLCYARVICTRFLHSFISTVYLSLMMIRINPQITAKASSLFQVPLSPLLPSISIAINVLLMTQLDRFSWVRLVVWIVIGEYNLSKILLVVILTHWGRDKMDAVSQTPFSKAFSWMKMYEFRLKFYWSLFLRVQLTIFQHQFR